MASDTSTRAAQLLDAAGALRAALRDFDPELVSAPDCARLSNELAVTEKACAAVQLLAASRATDAGAHREEGFSDPASWLARRSGTTGAAARAALALARSLDDHPKTKEALVSGAVSLDQAQEVLRAEEESPGQEEELLSLAEQSDLTRLRDETRERRLAAIKPEELHGRQLAARRFRHWKDGLGMIRLEGALPPETGIPLVTRIEREALRLRAEAKRTGEPEPFGAYAADALVSLLAQGGTGAATPVKTDLVIVCDLFAWRRGHTHEGEVCHIVGGGPIPVDLAMQLSKDAFLKCVLHDGKDVQRVFHFGRRYTAELKTALDLGAVPSFNGRACVDCGRTFGLERDHVDPVAHTGPTSMDNVVDRCYPCHQAKTERDRKAGLLGKRAKAAGGPPRRPGPPRGPGPARGAWRRGRAGASVRDGAIGPPGHGPP